LTHIGYELLDNDFAFYGQIKQDNYIFFSKNYFDILNFNISKASIFITLKENIEKFLQENKNQNIKPLYLKKIEDVDILLNILEEDLNREKLKHSQQDKIEYLDIVDIKNFFSIKDITLDNLKNKKEIYIVGENGDGKTLLLQAIAIGLKGTKEDGLKEFREREDEFRIKIDNREKIQNNFFAYGSSRNDNCKLKEDREGYLNLFSGEYDLKSPIKWLQYLDYSEQKEDSESSISVKKAKKILQHLLNREIDIEISPKEVIFKEKGSTVSFEQLSSGYRSVITIICDLVARLSEKQKVEDIEDFRGVVLIDEVELHLHPKWQYSFIKKLRETFPKIQFIVTTHSPTVLLGASVDAIYFNIYKESGVIKISEQKSIKNDFLNDIQSSIFGFDVDWERVDNPSSDDTNRHNLAKENLLNLIKKIDREN